MRNPFRRRKSRKDSESQTETADEPPDSQAVVDTQDAFAQTSNTQVFVSTSTQWEDDQVSIGRTASIRSNHSAIQQAPNKVQLKEATVQTSTISIPPKVSKEATVQTSNISIAPKVSKETIVRTSINRTPSNVSKPPRESLSQKIGDWVGRKSSTHQSVSSQERTSDKLVQTSFTDIKESHTRLSLHTTPSAQSGSRLSDHQERNSAHHLPSPVPKGLSLDAPAPLHVSSPRDAETNELKVDKPVVIFPADKPGLFFMPGITNLPLLAPFPFPPFFPLPFPPPIPPFPMPPLGIKHAPLIQPLGLRKHQSSSEPAPRKEAPTSPVESSQDILRPLHTRRRSFTKDLESHPGKDSGENKDSDFSSYLFGDHGSREGTDSYIFTCQENPNPLGEEKPSQKRTYICKKCKPLGNNKTYTGTATDKSCMCQKDANKDKQLPSVQEQPTTFSHRCQCCLCSLPTHTTSRCGFRRSVCDGSFLREDVTHINASMHRSIQICLRSSNKRKKPKVKKYNFSLETIKILTSLFSGTRSAALDCREVSDCRRRNECYNPQNRPTVDHPRPATARQKPNTVPCPCEASSSLSSSSSLKAKESFTSKCKRLPMGRHLKQLMSKFDKDLTDLPERQAFQRDTDTEESGGVKSPYPDVEFKRVSSEDKGIKYSSVPLSNRRSDAMPTFFGDDMFTVEKCARVSNKRRDKRDRCASLASAKRKRYNKISSGKPACFQTSPHCCECKCECCRIKEQVCIKEINSPKKVCSVQSQTDIQLGQTSKNTCPKDNQDSRKIYQPKTQESLQSQEETNTSFAAEREKHSSTTERVVNINTDAPTIDANCEDTKQSSQTTTTCETDQNSDAPKVDQQETSNVVGQETVTEIQIQPTDFEFSPRIENILNEKYCVFKKKCPCNERTEQAARQKRRTPCYKINHDIPCQYRKECRSDDNKSTPQEHTVINEKNFDISPADRSSLNEQYTLSSEEEDSTKPSDDQNMEKQGQEPKVHFESTKEDKTDDSFTSDFTDGQNEGQTIGLPHVARCRDPLRQGVRNVQQAKQPPERYTSHKQDSHEYNSWKPSIFCTIKRKSSNTKETDFPPERETSSRNYCYEYKHNKTKSPRRVCLPLPQPPEPAEDVKPVDIDEPEEDSIEPVDIDKPEEDSIEPVDIDEPEEDSIEIQEPVNETDSVGIIYAMSNSKFFKDSLNCKPIGSMSSSPDNSQEQSTICNLPDLDSDMSDTPCHQDRFKDISHLLRMQSSTNNVSQHPDQPDGVSLFQGVDQQIKRNKTFTSKNDCQQLKRNNSFTYKNESQQSERNNILTSNNECQQLKRDNTFMSNNDKQQLKRNNTFTSNNDKQQLKRNNTFTSSDRQQFKRNDTVTGNKDNEYIKRKNTFTSKNVCQLIRRQNTFTCKKKCRHYATEPSVQTALGFSEEKNTAIFAVDKGTKKHIHFTDSLQSKNKSSKKIKQDECEQFSKAKVIADRITTESSVSSICSKTENETFQLPNSHKCKDREKGKIKVPRKHDFQISDIHRCKNDKINETEILKQHDSQLINIRRCRDCPKDDIDVKKQQILQSPNIHRCRNDKSNERDSLNQHDLNLINVHRCRVCPNEQSDSQQQDFQLPNIHNFENDNSEETYGLQQHDLKLPNVRGCRDFQIDETDAKQQDFQSRHVHRYENDQSDETNAFKQQLPNIRRCRDCQNDKADAKQEEFDPSHIHRYKNDKSHETNALKQHDLHQIHVRRCRDGQNDKADAKQLDFQSRHIHGYRNDQSDETNALKQHDLKEPNVRRCRDCQNDKADATQKDFQSPHVHRNKNDQSDETNGFQQQLPNIHRCRDCEKEDIDVNKQQNLQLPNIHKCKNYQNEEVEHLNQHEIHVPNLYISNRKQMKIKHEQESRKNSVFGTIKNRKAKLKGDFDESGSSQQTLNHDQSVKVVNSQPNVTPSMSLSVDKTEDIDSSDIKTETNMARYNSNKGLNKKKLILIKETDSNKARDSVGVIYAMSKNSADGEMLGRVFRHKDNSQDSSTMGSLPDLDWEISGTHNQQHLLKDISEILRRQASTKEDSYNPSYYDSKNGYLDSSKSVPTRCCHSVLQCNCSSKMQKNRKQDGFDCSCTNLGHHLLVCRPCSRQFGPNHCLCPGQQPVNLHHPSKDRFNSNQGVAGQSSSLENCRLGRYVIVKSNSNNAETSPNVSWSYLDQEKASLGMSSCAIPSEEVSFHKIHSTKHRRYFAYTSTEYKHQTSSPSLAYFGNLLGHLSSFISPELGKNYNIHTNNAKYDRTDQQGKGGDNFTIEQKQGGSFTIKQQQQEGSFTISKIVTGSKITRLCLQQGCRYNVHINNREECKKVHSQDLTEQSQCELNIHKINDTSSSKEDTDSIYYPDNKHIQTDLRNTSRHKSYYSEPGFINTIRNHSNQSQSEISKNSRKTSKLCNDVSYDSCPSENNVRINIRNDTNMRNPELCNNISNESNRRTGELSITLSNDNVQSNKELSITLSNDNVQSNKELTNSVSKVSDINKQEFNKPINSESNPRITSINDINPTNGKLSVTPSNNNLQSNTELTNHHSNVSDISKQLSSNVSNDSSISRLMQSSTLCSHINGTERQANNTASNHGNGTTQDKINCLMNHQEISNRYTGDTTTTVLQNCEDLNTKAVNDSSLSTQEDNNAMSNDCRKRESSNDSEINNGDVNSFVSIISNRNTGEVKNEEHTEGKISQQETSACVNDDGNLEKEEADSLDGNYTVTCKRCGFCPHYNSKDQSHKDPKCVGSDQDGIPEDTCYTDFNHIVRSHTDPIYTDFNHDVRSHTDPIYTDFNHDVRSHTDTSYGDFSQHVRSRGDPSCTDQSHYARSHGDSFPEDTSHKDQRRRGPNDVELYYKEQKNADLSKPDHIRTQEKHQDIIKEDHSCKDGIQSDPSKAGPVYKGLRLGESHCKYKITRHKDSSDANLYYRDMGHKESSDAELDYQDKKHINSNDAEIEYQDMRHKKSSDAELKYKGRRHKESSDADCKHKNTKPYASVDAELDYKGRRHKESSDADCKHKNESIDAELKSKDRSHKESSDAELDYKGRRHNESSDANCKHKNTRPNESIDAELKYKVRSHKDKESNKPKPDNKDRRYKEFSDKESKYKLKRHTHSSDAPHSHKNRTNKHPHNLDSMHENEKDKDDTEIGNSGPMQSSHAQQNHDEGTLSYNISFSDSGQQRLETYSNIKCTRNQTELFVKTETHIYPVPRSSFCETPSSPYAQNRQEVAAQEPPSFNWQCREKRQRPLAEISHEETCVNSKKDQAIRKEACQMCLSPCLNCASPQEKGIDARETNYPNQRTKIGNDHKDKSSLKCRSLSESRGFPDKMFTTSASTTQDRKLQTNSTQPYKWQPKENYPHFPSSDSSQLQISSDSFCQDKGKPCPPRSRSPDFFTSSIDSSGGLKGYLKCQIGEPVPVFCSQYRNPESQYNSFMGTGTEQPSPHLCSSSQSQRGDNIPKKSSECSYGTDSFKTDSCCRPFKMCNMLPCQTCGQIKDVLRKQNCCEISSTSVV